MFRSLLYHLAPLALAYSRVAAAVVDQSVLNNISIFEDSDCEQQNATLHTADGRNFVLRRGEVALTWPKEHNATIWSFEKVTDGNYPSSWYVFTTLPDGERTWWYSSGGDDYLRVQRSVYSRTAFTLKTADTNSSRPRVAVWNPSGTHSYLNYEPTDGRVYFNYDTEPDNVIFEPVHTLVWNSTDNACDGLYPIDPPQPENVVQQPDLGIQGKQLRPCKSYSDCSFCWAYERCCWNFEKKEPPTDEKKGWCMCGTSDKTCF